MAQNVVINVRINNQAGVRSIREVGTAATTSLNTLNDLETAAELLNEELRRLPQGTREFNEMAQQLRIVNTELRNADLAMEVLDNEQLGSSIKGAAGGLADIAGGLALIGVSGEGVEKIAQTFAQIEGLSKIIGGAFDVWNEGLKLIKAGQTAAAAASARLTAATTAQSVATQGAAVKQGILNAVMNANPIFLLITGVAALVGAFALFTSSSEEAEEAEKKRLETQKKAIEADREQRKSIAAESGEFVGLIYQLKATNKNSKERSNLINNINSKYGTTLKNISDETLFQQQLNVAVDEYIRLQTVRFRIGKNEEAINRALEKQLDLEQKIGKARKEIQEAADAQGISFGEASRKLLEGTDLEKFQKDLDAVNERLKGYGLRINQLKGDEDKLTDGGNKYVEQTQNSIASTNEQTKSYQDASEALDKLIAAEEKLNKINQEIGEYEYAKNIQESIDKQLESIQKSGQYTTESFNMILDAEKKRKDDIIINEAEILKSKTTNAIEIEAIDKEMNLKLSKNEDEYVNKKETTYDLLEKAQEDYADNVVSSEKKVTEDTIAEIEARKIATEQYLDAIKNGFDALASAFEADSFDEINSSFNELNNMVSTIMDSIIKLMATFDELTSVEKVEGIVKMIAAIASATSSIITSSMNEKIENTLNANLAAISEEEEALKSSLVNRLISQAEYDQATLQLEQQKDEATKSAQRKQFENEKKNAIAQAVISGSLATLKAFQQFGFPLGLIPAGIIAGITGLQIGIISKKNFTAARGGVVPGNGPSNIDSVPAMLAPGEVVLNAKASSAFLPMLSAMNESTGGIPLVSGLNESYTPQIIKVYDENKNNKPIQAYITDTQVRDAIKALNKKENRGKMFK